MANGTVMVLELSCLRNGNAAIREREVDGDVCVWTLPLLGLAGSLYTV